MTVAGMPVACRTIMTRRGKRMAFLTLEDQYGSLEVIVFEEVYNRCYDLLRGDNPAGQGPAGVSHLGRAQNPGRGRRETDGAPRGQKAVP